MTIVKKAKKLLATADNGSKECKIYNDGFLDGAEWGYKEAMRWRNPIEELPKEGVTVQVKMFNAHDNILEYIYDEYLGKNKWRKCTSKYINIGNYI